MKSKTPVVLAVFGIAAMFCYTCHLLGIFWPHPVPVFLARYHKDFQVVGSVCLLVELLVAWRLRRRRASGGSSHAAQAAHL